MRVYEARLLKREERSRFRGKPMIAPPWLEKSPKLGRTTKTGILLRLVRNETMTSQTMASEIGRHKGTIQEAVRRMIVTWGEKIGSGASGFFLIKSEEQKEAAVQFLFSQAYTRIKRIAKLLDTTPDKVWSQYKQNGNGNGSKE